MATSCQGSAILILGLFCTKYSAECSVTNEIFAQISFEYGFWTGHLYGGLPLCFPFKPGSSFCFGGACQLGLGSRPP